VSFDLEGEDDDGDGEFTVGDVQALFFELAR
jgi:hypothetical protein